MARMEKNDPSVDKNVGAMGTLLHNWWGYKQMQVPKCPSAEK